MMCVRFWVTKIAKKKIENQHSSVERDFFSVLTLFFYNLKKKILKHNFCHQIEVTTYRTTGVTGEYKFRLLCAAHDKMFIFIFEKKKK